VPSDDDFDAALDDECDAQPVSTSAAPTISADADVTRESFLFMF